MFSIELEMTIAKAYRRAREQWHEHITVDHLTLAILDLGAVSDGLRASDVDIDHFRLTLNNSITSSTKKLRPDNAVDTQPTTQFQRVLQRAVYAAKTSRAKEVTALDVMTAIFSEEESASVAYLSQQGVSRAQWVGQIEQEGVDLSTDRDAPAILAANSSAFAAREISSSSSQIGELEARVRALEQRLAVLEAKLQP